MVYTFSQSCWAWCYEEAVCCLYSPLNVCLASGDLHKRDFHHYINQWGHFLIAFPQAFDLVLESLEDQQEDVKAAILERRNFITQELQWHASFIQECDLDPTAGTSWHSVAAKDLEFLLGTASGNLDMVHLGNPSPAEKRIAAHVLSAITPCVQLSATLASLIKLVSRTNKRPCLFNMWIGRYSDELEASALQIEELLNWLSNSLSNEKRRVPRDVYYQAFAQITLSPAQEKSIFGLPPRAGNTHFLVSHADLRSACNDIAVFDKREGDKWSLAILAIQTAVGYEYDSLCKVLEQPFLVRENGTYTFVLKGLMKSAPPGDSIESNLSWLIICTLASVVLPSQVPMSLPGCFTFDSNAPPNDGGAGKRKSTREPDPYFLRCRHCGCRIVARNLTVEFGLLYRLLDVPQRRLRFALEIQHDRNVIRFDSLCVSCNTILGFAYLSVIHRWQFHFLFREMVY